MRLAIRPAELALVPAGSEGAVRASIVVTEPLGADMLVVDRGELKMRWMTPREYARLQGAPDYTIECGVSQALFGFGDAVCVPVIQWIDEQILTPLYEAAQQQTAEAAAAR